MNLTIHNKPSKDEMMTWIQGFTKWPHRQTGTPEGEASASYVEETFKKLGLVDVEIEPVQSVCRETSVCELQIEDASVDCFLANGTNRKDEIGESNTNINNAELIYLGKGLDEDFEDVDVTNKIVVCDIYFKPHKQKNFLNYFDGSKAYDPLKKLDKNLNLYNIYSPNNWPFNYMHALKKGAVGFIGILQNFMDSKYFHEDYTDIVDIDGYMEIPALWVSRNDGEQIKKILKENGSTVGKMKVKTNYQYKNALNVKGVVKGKSDDIIVIHSHHDAMCRGAVQDASGMSVVFSLAKYFASLPKEEVKSTLMFLSTDSHYTDYEGHVGFLNKREANGDNIIMDLAIEHVGKAMELDSNNNIVLYDESEARMMYVADEKSLPDIVYQLVEKNNLEKTMILPIKHKSGGEFTSDDVNSDAYDFNSRGIPVVSILTAPMYLYHDSDEIDKVHQESLEPLALTYLELVYKVWDTFEL